MIIFKSDDVAKWTELLLGDVEGTKFHMTNPRTGEEDQAFELKRTPAEILKHHGMCPMEMFDFLWETTENFDKMEMVNQVIRRRFDLSKIETQNLLTFFHLNLPKRESGHPVQLKTWKKWRNREDIVAAYTEDIRNGKDKIRICSDDYIMRDLIKNGKFNWTAAVALLNNPLFNNPTPPELPKVKFGEPVLKE